MNKLTYLLSVGAISFAALFSGSATASEFQKAIDNGATKLTAPEITARLTNKTMTFENMNTGAKALVYYDGKNGTILRLVGSDQILKGFYATDLSDHVCLGIHNDKPMRLRCVNVLLIDGIMHKFELDGSLRGRIIEEVSGNII